MRSVRLTFTGNIMFLQIEPGGRAVEQQAIEKIVAPYIRDGRIIRDDLLALARDLRAGGFDPVDFPTVH
jgi:hypothetical protein